MKAEEVFNYSKKRAIAEAIEHYLSDRTSEEKASFADLLEQVLDCIMRSEREIFLSGNSSNKANGFYPRTLSTALGKLNISAPRDRNGEFRSSILPDKWIRSTKSYENLLLSLVTNGYSRNNLIGILKQLGLPYSKDELEKIEDDILRRLEEFKTKELPENAFVLYIDAYHGKLRENTGKVRKCCIYTVLGVDLEGNREVYGFYVLLGSENKGEWIKIFNDLVTRGLKRTLLIVSDDLSGLDDAIEAIFPKTDHQLCYVHLQRNVKRNMSKEDSKEFNRRLRETYIYGNNFDEAKDKLDNILEDYKNKYPLFISHLLKKEGKYLSFMKYPQQVRKFIYTTNIIENFNSLLEKIRLRLGGYFASKQILGINVMLQCEKLDQTKWKKPHPVIRGEVYEINQIFKLRFYENNLNLKSLKNSQTQSY